MSRYLNQPISVRCRDGRPVALARGKQRLRVLSLTDHWREVGYWWEGEGEKEFFLLEVARADVPSIIAPGPPAPSHQIGKPYLIYRDLSTGDWFLYKILD